ncbi:MAG: sugar kinase [Spirochaetia bacterium]|jgi:2-dehydro-3-deoxygluconokinase
MAKLVIRDAQRCRWDLLALGAIIQRFDTGVVPLHLATRFERYCAGGEYNVAANLARAFRMRAVVATANVQYPPGWWAEEEVRKTGVEALYRWFPFDGVRGPRIANTYCDRGMGVRAPEVWYDRANEAAALLAPGDFDWKDLFEKQGVRWFHTGGIFASLSESTAKLIIEAMKAARTAGVVVSYDLNYRKKLWDAFEGGPARALQINREIASHADMLFAGEEDLRLRLGVPGPDAGLDGEKREIERLGAMIDVSRTVFPNMSVLATTFRTLHSASRHGLRAVLWHEGKMHTSEEAELDIYDRVGSGDGFAAGLIYGLLSGQGSEAALRLGWAHGALLTTYPGDITMARREQVEAIAEGGEARVIR